MLSLALCGSISLAFSPSSTTAPTASTAAAAAPTSTRSQFLKQVLLTTATAAAVTVSTPQNAFAATSAATAITDKQYNLPSETIAQIVSRDLTENAFLTNGQLTRSIYDEKATFTDEIDTYTLPQWIKGTAQLFVPPPYSVGKEGNKGSRVGLVGDVIATNEKVEFKFEEDLMFNIPFKPIVFVSGKVILERDAESGLITSYREFWDQDVPTVLKSARFK